MLAALLLSNLRIYYQAVTEKLLILREDFTSTFFFLLNVYRNKDVREKCQQECLSTAYQKEEIDILGLRVRMTSEST